VEPPSSGSNGYAAGTLASLAHKAGEHKVVETVDTRYAARSKAVNRVRPVAEAAAFTR
jgi:hypothetical protein